MASLGHWCAGGGESADPPPVLRAGSGKEPAKAHTRILIIEDDFFVASHLEALLNGLSFESSDIASEPQGAIRQAAASPPDLLLVDVNLEASIDGIETARRICTARPVPLIFVTAYTDAGTMNRIRRAFPHAPVLHKPVAAEQLNTAIELALRTTS